MALAHRPIANWKSFSLTFWKSPLMGKRKTTAPEGFRDAEAFIPRTVEGCLYKQIYDAVNLTKELVDAIPKVGTGTEFGKVEYPQRTLHEFIANAVIHRDYS